LDQVENGETQGRVHFGSLINLDEGYKFLRMLGLVRDKKGIGRDGADTSIPPDAASEFNRLMQTGTSCLTTKTSGTFGEGEAPSISLGLVGNAHPWIVVPMLQGSIGVNHAAALERVLLVSARPVEPHSPVPKQLDLPPSFQRWVWPPLLQCNVEHLGLPTGVTNPARAAALLAKARLDGQGPGDSDDENEDDSLFVPDASGYHATLGDGVETRIRFRRHGDRLLAEFRVPNRDVPIPLEQQEDAVARRVLEYFSEPHVGLEFTQTGRLTFQGLTTAFTVQCAAARDANEVMRAAMLGACPWHLAMLAAGLLLLELGFGECDGSEAARNKSLRIDESHVVRAYDLLGVLLAQREMWHGEAPAQFLSQAFVGAERAG